MYCIVLYCNFSKCGVLLPYDIPVLLSMRKKSRLVYSCIRYEPMPYVSSNTRFLWAETIQLIWKTSIHVINLDYVHVCDPCVMDLRVKSNMNGRDLLSHYVEKLCETQ